MTEHRILHIGDHASRSPHLHPGISVHVIQRGNNRVPIFGSSNDFEQFLELLRRSARNFCVTLHAFVLMTNHYHLIVTPTSDGGLPKMMKALDGGTFAISNARALGTLWNGAIGAAARANVWRRACVSTEPGPSRMVQAPTTISGLVLATRRPWPTWYAAYVSVTRPQRRRTHAYRSCADAVVETLC